jgi:DNA-binding PadR family transcriptional regulator
VETRLEYAASSITLYDCLKFTEKVNLIDRKVENGKEFYKATPKGLEFLQRYREITELIRTENNRNNVKVPPTHLLREPNLKSKF